MPFNFLLNLFNFILPPRGTEAAVGSLTLEHLRDLQTSEGLPYADEAVRALVWELKYYANRRAGTLAGELLSEELLAIASEELGRPLLIPVPMHKARRRERGHNQTELLCEAALRHLGGAENLHEKIVWPASAPARDGRPEDFFSGKLSAPLEYSPQALKRIKATPEQQKLDRAKRLKNVKGSMQADPTLVRGRVCVVVDDVTTTGATLAEATRALKAAGAQRVHTIALAQS